MKSNSFVVFTRALIAALFVLASATPAMAEEDIARVHQSPATIGIATGHQVPLNLAPAVATVITAEELDAIGATTLSEALALVPGVNVLYRSQGDHYIFRGIRADSSWNPDWLLLVDGVPQNDIQLGNQRQFMGDIPLQNIARIEVIRGPGSALYGADAFAGVVSIITKRPEDVTSSEARIRGGSWDTREARYLHSGELFGASTLLALQVKKTDGFRPFIEKDSQTFQDNRSGTRASLAPGRATSWENDYNLSWEIQHDAWRLRWRHHTKEDAQMFGSALDPNGWFYPRMNSVDLLYDQPRYSEHWEVKGHLSWFKLKNDSYDTWIYPPGAFGFTDGVRDEIGYTEDRGHGELSGLYKGIQHHAVLLGAGAAHHRSYDTRERRNYTLAANGTPIPIGQMVELPPEQAFAPNGDRTIYFAYMQDEWAFARDWTLTSGIRYDHYSDFGAATSPRMALVWATTADLTTKLMAGRAFRAPTFLDLYARNSLAVTGNPDLRPEEIDTYELSFNYQPMPTFRTGINAFQHTITDKIHAVRGTLGTSNQNIGRQEGQGGEWEWQWIASDTVTWNGWYAHQRNKVISDGSDPGFAPRDSASLRVDWKLASNWLLNTNATWVANRIRPVTDVRGPVADYTIWDMTLQYKPRRSAWSAAVSVFNLFDRSAEDPGNPPGRDRSDHELPGRSVFAEIRYYPSW